MKNIKIIFTFILLFILASCGYNLPNKPVPSSKSREYPKKTNYSEAKINKAIKQAPEKFYG